MPTGDIEIETKQSLQSAPSRSCDVTLGADFDVAAALGGRAATVLYVGTGGTVICRLLNDAVDAWRTFKNLPNGGELVRRVVAVRSTANGTTAADIIASTY